ncbi:MAG: cell division protein FtsZ [Bacillota bacterium]
MENNNNVMIPKIKVLGIGGGGVNALYRNMKNKNQFVEFVAVNTDLKSLVNKKCDTQVQIGEKLTKGQGAGTNPEIGKLACEESSELIKKVIENIDMLIITAGMGGGTGTGAVPVVAKIAKEMGILVVAIVTLPFSFEGAKRMETAKSGVSELSKYVDSLVVIENSKLLSTLPKSTKLMQAFEHCDGVLSKSIGAILNILIPNGEINLDFNDLKTTLQNKGAVYMNIGTGSGENKLSEALNSAMENAIIETKIHGITDAIINIASHPDSLGLSGVEYVSDQFKKAVGDKVNIIFGLQYDMSMQDSVEITVIGSKAKEI